MDPVAISFPSINLSWLTDWIKSVLGGVLDPVKIEQTIAAAVKDYWSKFDFSGFLKSLVTNIGNAKTIVLTTLQGLTAAIIAALKTAAAATATPLDDQVVSFIEHLINDLWNSMLTPTTDPAIVITPHAPLATFSAMSAANDFRNLSDEDKKAKVLEILARHNKNGVGFSPLLIAFLIKLACMLGAGILEKLIEKWIGLNASGGSTPFPGFPGTAAVSAK